MEAASIPESPAARPPRPVARAIADNILWLLLGLALVVYFIKDPKQTLDDVKTGLSNGTIWALIALGYTLVYGIIELINFAHGEVFMIGSFVSFGLYGTLGLSLATGPLGLVVGVRPKGVYSAAAVSEPSMKTSPWAKLISSMIP